MRLAWISFTHSVRVGMSTFEQLFSEANGWRIEELEPGRVMLTHTELTGARIITVDSVPYSFMASLLPFIGELGEVADPSVGSDDVAPAAALEAKREPRSDTRRKRR